MTRDLIPPLPANVRQDVNLELQGKQLAMLDDNARFIVRRLVAHAYGHGYDDGVRAGTEDAHADERIRRDKEKAT